MKKRKRKKDMTRHVDEVKGEDDKSGDRGRLVDKSEKEADKRRLIVKAV